MSTLTRRRRTTTQRVAIAAGLLGLSVALSVAALFSAAANPPCSTPTTAPATGVGATFSAPLQLEAGRWYPVGATEYGGPRDPSSGSYGSSGTYLPGHPDSFAELSVLDTNPATGGGSLSFQDADALSNLPYGTLVRVTHNGHELTLTKQDIGYGQGPGQPIPYRMDVWWQAAAQLNISKSTVMVQRLPTGGSGGVLNQLPAGTQPTTPASAACHASTTTTPGVTPTPITAGQVAEINPLTGIASAPAAAPAAVKAAIAAGNQLINLPYIWGGGHADLDQLATGYDCSGSAEYVLHHAGLFTPTAGPSSSFFTDHYPAGAGRWITLYANAEHMWLVVAGVVLDTAWYSTVTPMTPDSGPRWQPATTVQQQIAGNAAAGYPAFTVSRPAGL